MAIYPVVLPNYACRRPIGWAAYAVMRGGRCGSLEHYARGGIRPCIKAAAVCETPRIAGAIHSSGELGIQLPTMLHMSSVLPNLSYAADAHYHHLVDDVIVGGKLAYRDGAIEVPGGPVWESSWIRRSSVSIPSCSSQWADINMTAILSGRVGSHSRPTTDGMRCLRWCLPPRSTLP